MRPYIYGERDGIHIIDLLQTEQLLAEARRFAADIASKGGAMRYGLARQFLHAHRLAFAHPASGEPLSFESPLPEDLAAALDQARQP